MVVVVVSSVEELLAEPPLPPHAALRTVKAAKAT
jgi:hypothetical protein